MSSNETVFQEPREALEDPKTSTLLLRHYSPCERETPMALPPCEPVLWATWGRCTEARSADGAGDRSDRCLIPRPLSCAEGDLVQLPSEPSSREVGAAVVEGNRVYDII